MKRRPFAGRPYLTLAAVLGLASLAPTPGDIGGCGQAAEPLSAPTFYASRLSIECRRCSECGATEDCAVVCDAAPSAEFPAGCEPLVHDGTVCLRALEQASCDQVAGLLEVPPAEPPECQFCPPEASPEAADQ